MACHPPLDEIVLALLGDPSKRWMLIGPVRLYLGWMILRCPAGQRPNDYRLVVVVRSFLVRVVRQRKVCAAVQGKDPKTVSLLCAVSGLVRIHEALASSDACCNNAVVVVVAAVTPVADLAVAGRYMRGVLESVVVGVGSKVVGFGRDNVIVVCLQKRDN